MATIACVTCVTPDDVTVEHKDNALIVKVDGLGIWIDGLTQPEQLRNLAMIANKLLRTHDDIAAQARLFDGEA